MFKKQFLNATVLIVFSQLQSNFHWNSDCGMCRNDMLWRNLTQKLFSAIKKYSKCAVILTSSWRAKKTFFVSTSLEKNLYLPPKKNKNKCVIWRDFLLLSLERVQEQKHSSLSLWDFALPEFVCFLHFETLTIIFWKFVSPHLLFFSLKTCLLLINST